jgi:hypothetical protein
VLARRLLLLAAVLMLLAALAASVAPRDLTGGDNEPAPAVSSLPAGTIVARDIPVTPGAAPVRVAVSRGDTLELEVHGDLLDEVLIERLDLMDAMAPGTPARFNILVDAPAGSYPIRLVEADSRIGSIVISD